MISEETLQKHIKELDNFTNELMKDKNKIKQFLISTGVYNLNGFLTNKYNREIQ